MVNYPFATTEGIFNYMAQIVDITGNKYHKLTVIGMIPNKIPIKWVCKCDCGKIKFVIGGNLKSGGTKSCGCDKKKSNGLSRTSIYQVYKGIIQRCYNHKNKDYRNYGGRGITVCDEWRNSFIVFYNWSVSSGYDKSLQIDRINNNGNYEPLNCRWATLKQQGRNRRTNNIIEYNGKSQCLSDWAEELGISRSTFIYRIKKQKHHADTNN